MNARTDTAWSWEMTCNHCNHHGKARLCCPPHPPLWDIWTSPWNAHTKPLSDPLPRITSPCPPLRDVYLRAGGAESPNCCWGVVCSPGHRTLCVKAVQRHRKTCGLGYFTCEVSTVHKVTLWIGHPLRGQLLRLLPCLSQRLLMESSQALPRPPRRDAPLTGPRHSSH